MDLFCLKKEIAGREQRGRPRPRAPPGLSETAAALHASADGAGSPRPLSALSRLCGNASSCGWPSRCRARVNSRSQRIP